MRTVVDVDPSPGNRRDRRYGRKVINLKQKFRKRHPFLWVLILCALVVALFWSVREVSTRAEVTDVYPSTCLGDWQNPANAVGDPETLASPSSSFTDMNSAISNGSGTIFCGGFFSTATPPPVGDITNVGLTLVWQVGDAATSTTAVVPLPVASSSVSSTQAVIVPAPTSTSVDSVATTSISVSSSPSSNSSSAPQVPAPPAQASTTASPPTAPPASSSPLVLH